MRILKKWYILIWFIPLVVFTFITLTVYVNQDRIVQSHLASMNKTFHGKLTVGDSHLALFENFPHISLKIDDVLVKEHKTANAPIILDVADIYLGFNIWDVVIGNYDIKSLVVEEGVFDITLHTDGSTNIENALALSDSPSADSGSLNVHLKNIELRNIEFHQREEATKTDISTQLFFAKGGFKTEGDQILAHVDSKFILDLIQDGDTSYLHNKHFEFHTDVDFNKHTGMLHFAPSGITMEHGDFELEGKIDTKNDFDVAIDLKGTKPNFDMLIAFAPTELIPVLERYENEGKIYFNAKIEGPTTNGQQPFIEAFFGANQAILENRASSKKIDQMGFSGHFTNGSSRNFKTMEFEIKDVKANIDGGSLLASVSVINFEEPDIKMAVDANFDLGFWADFLNLKEVQDLDGHVEMHMKFHDIIDLDQPEKALEDLNQAYYAELIVEDLSLASDDLPAKLHELDIHIEMNGHQASLDTFYMQLGNSDLSLTGTLSDLPAIVHHRAKPIKTHLDITANHLDIAQITGYSQKDSTGFNEKINDLSLQFSFNALGNAFTEFTHLPKGEFFIDNLYADLQNYPHTLHDFHADVLVKDDSLNIIDFTGNIDQTDFHFNGLIEDYSFWMQEELNGEVGVDLTLRSDLFRLNDLFTYKGENYVPKDYRHEEVEHMEIHVGAQMKYDSSQLKAIHVKLDKWTGKMHIHPLRFEDFSGNFNWEKEHLTATHFKGKMGRTNFNINLDYYLGQDPTLKKRNNYFSITSDRIDFDQLFSYSTSSSQSSDSAAHDSAFNIFELPFTDMKFDAQIKHLLYHRYDLKDFMLEMRTSANHTVRLDTFFLKAADGQLAMKGILDGTDPAHIHLKPDMHIQHMDLDSLLFKFENFGQDYILSNNLHGKLTAKIWGDIRIYPDLTPDLDQSEIHVDAQVLNGSLVNYEPMQMLGEYFGDKNLNYVRFDTIANHMDVTNGTLTIPNMVIESSLGHLEISGTHGMNDSINYFIRVPWSMVKDAAKNKIFGSKSASTSTQDEILEVDPNKHVRYLNVNIYGTVDDYSYKLKKAKK